MNVAIVCIAGVACLGILTLMARHEAQWQDAEHELLNRNEAWWPPKGCRVALVAIRN